MSSPLQGVKVLDLTTVILGPYTTQILGEMGAEVIKVEAPAGDSTRFTGPRRSADMAALFMNVNRHKRSIVLDLKQSLGREAFWRLVDWADILVHNMRPQKMAKLGFSPEAVLARNPKIVYAGLYGYRQGGPYELRPAYDDIIQGQSGIVDLMSRATGEVRYAPTVMADKTCALAAAYSILAGLFARERSGAGQVVEMPMFETMVSFVFVEHLYGGTFVGDGGEVGYGRALDPWRQPYPTKDGYICMMAYTDVQWSRFWTEVGRDDLKHDPRFVDFASRAENISALYELAGGLLRERSTSEWEDVLSRAEIPNTRVNTLDDLLEDPHLESVGFFQSMRHDTEGDILVTDTPTRFNGERGRIQRLQPHLGEHSVEVLQEVGLTPQEIEAMIAEGACLDGRGVRLGVPADTEQSQRSAKSSE
ncbi:CoA transferase [Streptosporangium jomthongense]|uniref:CaiB/BaiF CoA transferase family protein n=1 Tax=Marinobacter aromaticivorans TaxID=1494078 RepID=A0ABW2IZ51_9GAMM|nr:CoA transferase [Marinobacter aromaticivorans]GGE79417.1 CoA transferase [Streptosporangium jomthongense]